MPPHGGANADPSLCSPVWSPASIATPSRGLATLFLLAPLAPAATCSPSELPPNAPTVRLVTRTTGCRHESIAPGSEATVEGARARGIRVVASEDPTGEDDRVGVRGTAPSFWFQGGAAEPRRDAPDGPLLGERGGVQAKAGA